MPEDELQNPGEKAEESGQYGPIDTCGGRAQARR